MKKKYHEIPISHTFGFDKHSRDSSSQLDTYPLYSTGYALYRVHATTLWYL